jgi:hypothetical protein
LNAKQQALKSWPSSPILASYQEYGPQGRGCARTSRADYLLKGHPPPRIAKELFISPATVNNHCVRMREKLRGRTLMRYAMHGAERKSRKNDRIITIANSMPRVLNLLYRKTEVMYRDIRSYFVFLTCTNLVYNLNMYE